MSEEAPPQAINPDWMWERLPKRRSGSRHQEEPFMCSISTEVRAGPFNVPPVTTIAEIDEPYCLHGEHLHGALDLRYLFVPQDETL